MIFKATFGCIQSHSEGGPSSRTTYIKLFDALTAEELQKRIDDECRNDEYGYKKYKKLIDICKID